MVDSRKDLGMELGSLRKTDIYCPHCDDFVPKTTFYRHKKQFYNVVNGEWGDDNLLMKQSNPKSSQESTTKLKTTSYQPEYQAQIDDDSFNNAFMDTSEISLGPNADEQESGAEGRFFQN